MWSQNRDLLEISMTPNRSPTVPSSSTSHSPENLIANCSISDSLSTDKLVAMESIENSASSYQVWHTGSVTNSSTVKLVARSKKSTIGQFDPSQFDHSQHSVGCLDKVFANVQQKLGRPKEGKNVSDPNQRCDLVHLGKDHEEHFTCFEEHRILRESAFHHHAEIGL